MKLYYSPGACSLAPHIVLREAAIPAQLIKVDLTNHTLDDGSDYYRINPRGYVPALALDDGTVLTEGAVLLQYLADQRPNSGLLPAAGTLARLRVLEWLTYIGTELHKTFSPWLWRKETPLPAKQIAQQKLATRFAELEQHLATRPWLTGDRFTIADAYAFTIVNWSNFLGVDLAPYPHLRAYLDRVARRPQVNEALRAEGLIPGAEKSASSGV